MVDHRLPEDMDTTREKTSGYIKRSTIFRRARESGFTLAAESRVNANPGDTHDHPEISGLSKRFGDTTVLEPTT